MKRRRLLNCLVSIALGVLYFPPETHSATSYDGERWFQIELSIFTNENRSATEQELWSPLRLEIDSLSQARRLDQISQFFYVEDFDARVNGVTLAEPAENAITTISPRQSSPIAIQAAPRQGGPFAFAHNPDLKFYDFARNAFLQLPESESEFTQTNRALESSPDHRLLLHALWRQPVTTSTTANKLFVDGGQYYGEHREFQGTITIRFNRNQDRVVIDANLLLAEFGVTEEELEWSLPDIPAALRELQEQAEAPTLSAPIQLRRRLQIGADEPDSVLTNPANITRVYQLKQSRDMRSGEFHYLDHPALGLVILVTPYDLPLPASELEELEELQKLEDLDKLSEDPLLPAQ